MNTLSDIILNDRILNDDEESEEINIENQWGMINSYFHSHGVENIQLDSYNSFIKTGIPSIIRDLKPIEAFNPDTNKGIRVTFGDVYMAKTSQPVFKESDGSYKSILPHEARIRNITYASPIYVDMYLQNFTKKSESKGH